MLNRMLSNFRDIAFIARGDGSGEPNPNLGD